MNFFPFFLSLDLEIVGMQIRTTTEISIICRTVYLCDDGKDPLKRKWCQRMGNGVQYVSGRTRGEKEMNGKSANLNNCLEQIYPDGLSIPHNELVYS